MQLFGFTIARTAALPPMQPPSTGAGGGWTPIVRESYPGAWQQNVTVNNDAALGYYAVYACVSLIASDCGKLCLDLVEETADGIWAPTDNPAFSPVLRKPNRYQTIHKFIEQWMTSKLINGNTYVLKQRDARGVVTALYVLDPMRCRPLVAIDGSVYYQVARDPLSQITDGVTIPASEIIHDTMITLFHPLVGVTPIYACGLAATQGLAIQANSSRFFANGSQPGGVLTAPGSINDETAARIKNNWDTNFGGNNIGKIAVLGDGLEYKPMTITAVDAQLIDQLKWTAENVCSCYHVPPYMIGVGPPPPYANIEPLLQQYYSQCIQSLLTNCEQCLEEGLGLLLPINGTQYGCEFDIDDLIWMDTATKTAAAKDGISAGALAPNEARLKYFGLGPVPGGDTPYMQEQNWPLRLLSQRELPTRPPTPPAPIAVPAAPAADATPDQQAAFHGAILRKTLEGLYGA